MRNSFNYFVRMMVLTVMAGSLPAAAADLPGYAETTLSGDWGGLREAWQERGLAVDFGYRWDMLRVASGGARRGGRPISHFDFKLKADLGKLAGWDGATVYLNPIYDGGGKTNRDFLGSQLGVSNLEVPVSTSRLFHAWFEQAFADGKWALLAGLYPIDSEFQGLDSAGVFVQPSYGAAPDLALTRGPSIFNNAAFGLRAKWLADDRTLYAMAAVLDGMPGDPQRPKGTHVRFDRGDGAMQIAEIGYKPLERGHVFEPTSPDKGVTQDPEIRAHELAEGYEKYALGFWRYTARADDLVDVDAAGLPERRRSAGWYAIAERTFWRWNGGYLSGFLRVGATDGDSTAIERYDNVGISVRGMLPGREYDVFGIARTRAATGAKFRAAQAAGGVEAVAAESAIEVTYRVQATKWLAVQPVVQRFRHPGAIATPARATVVGLRVDIAL